MTDPWVPAPAPRGPLFPEPAVPGTPPPPLPTDPPPLYRPDPVPGLPPDTVDPALDAGVDPLDPWHGRLGADAPPPWSVATLLTATAPPRHAPPPDFAFYDEPALDVTVLRLPEASLNPAPAPVPLLSRLRMLHRRLLPSGICWPVAADWYELGGRPAVLDRLATHPELPVAGFSLAAELAPDDGLLAVGRADPGRSATLTSVGIPLATTVRPHGPDLVWATPTGWTRSEELQLTTDRLLARVRLRLLPYEADLDRWMNVLYQEAPFLRDLRPLADRDVEVPGLEAARLHRFDWQPSGRDRVLTTVVAGITGEQGFSFVLEVPLGADADVLLADPDEILSWVRVGP